jgi:Uma2 family endonuclease
MSRKTACEAGSLPADSAACIPSHECGGLTPRFDNSDIKVRVSEKRYFHPDVTVSCDARDRGTADFIQSPRIVVEVLSPGTEANVRVNDNSISH